MNNLMKSNNNNNAQMKHKLKKLIDKYNKFIKEKGSIGLERLNEAEVRKDFIDPLFEILGWNIHDSSEYGAEEYIKGIGIADIILRDPSKVSEKSRSLVYIEAKRFGILQPKTTKTKQINLLGRFIPDWTEEDRQANNYAMAKNIKWAILTNFEKFRLFNAKNSSLIFNIEKPEEYLSRVNELKFLSKKSVLTGQLEQLESREERKDIDIDFLEFMHSCRLLIGNAIYEDNTITENGRKRKLTTQEINEATQRILDRLIIIRFAEDKLILSSPNLLLNAYKHWNSNRTYSSLSEMLFGNNMIFDSFNSQYNGKMFERGHLCEKVKIRDDILGIIIEQLNYVGFRKFTSDILGNTYEAYLGEQLTLDKGKIKLLSSRTIQKSKGIYYTPTTVVKYIVEESLRQRLEKIWQESQSFLEQKKIKEFIKSFSRIKELKVLDPAMGSGSFIISAFDLFAEYYEKCDETIRELKVSPKGIQLTESLLLNELTSRYENRILTENIYGVDLDKQAAEIASLNLFLRGLKKNVKLPLILEDNIKIGDSLISPILTKDDLLKYKEQIGELVKSREYIKEQMLIKEKDITDFEIQEATRNYLFLKEEIIQDLAIRLSKEEGGYFSDPISRHIFIWELEFPEVFFDEQGNIKPNSGFDYVIGNPPYIDIYKLAKNDPEGVEYFKDTFKCAKMKFDIYILFMERGYNLLNNNGRMSYIIPYPFIFQNYAESMRTLLLNESMIEEFVDLSPVKVFPSAHVKSLIFRIKKTDEKENIDVNKVKLTTIPSNKINDLLTEKKETNFIPQRFFHLMPNYMFRVDSTSDDIRLWEIVEKDSLPLSNICYVNWGLRTGDTKRTKEMIVKEKTHRKAHPMLRGENIEKPFYYSYSDQYIIYDKERLHNPLSEEVFENPKILIKKISGKKGVVSVVDTEKYYCYNTIIVCLPYPVLRDSKLLKKDMVKLSKKEISLMQDLYFITAVLNSDLVNYYYKTKLSDMLSMVPGHAQQLPIKIIDEKDEKQVKFYTLIINLSKEIHSLNKYLHEMLRSFTSVTKHFGFHNFKLLRSYIQTSGLVQTHDYEIDLLNTHQIGKRKPPIKLTQIDVRCSDLELYILGREEDHTKFEDTYKITFTDRNMCSFFEYAITQYIEENKRKKYWTKNKIEEILDEIQIPRSVENNEIDMKKINEMIQYFEVSLLKIIPEELNELQISKLNITEIRSKIEENQIEVNNLIYDLYQIPRDLVDHIKSKG